VTLGGGSVDALGVGVAGRDVSLAAAVAPGTRTRHSG
jgi:hypothetical protein